MLEPEYRTGFRVLNREIGLWSTLRAVIPAAIKSLKIHYKIDKNLDEAERQKRELKNHFKLLAFMYKEL